MFPSFMVFLEPSILIVKRYNDAVFSNRSVQAFQMTILPPLSGLNLDRLYSTITYKW